MQQHLTEPEVALPEQVKKRTTKKKETTATAEGQPAEENSLPIFTEAELKKKKVADLQKIVATLHIATSSKKKDELINKILTRQRSMHSEQFAIQNM